MTKPTAIRSRVSFRRSAFASLFAFDALRKPSANHRKPASHCLLTWPTWESTIGREGDDRNRWGDSIADTIDRMYASIASCGKLDGWPDRSGDDCRGCNHARCHGWHSLLSVYSRFLAPIRTTVQDHSSTVHFSRFQKRSIRTHSNQYQSASVMKMLFRSSI